MLRINTINKYREEKKTSQFIQQMFVSLLVWVKPWQSLDKTDKMQVLSGQDEQDHWTHSKRQLPLCPEQE